MSTGTRSTPTSTPQAAAAAKGLPRAVEDGRPPWVAKPVDAVRRALPEPARNRISALRSEGRKRSAVLRPLPQVLILGAMKAGTTSLFYYLAQHPQLVSGLQKEVEFYSMYWERGVDWYRGRYPLQPPWSDRIGLDASPYYLFHPAAPYRAKATVPDAKLLVILRDPVDRAISHYFHSRKVKTEDLSIEEALDAEPARLAGERARLLREPGYQSRSWRNHAYVGRSRYAEQIEQWLEHYDRSQLLVLDLADLEADVAGVYAEVLRFLGLPDYFPASVERKNIGVGDASTVPDGVRERLAAALDGEDEKLQALVGRRFSWFDS